MNEGVDNCDMDLWSHALIKWVWLVDPASCYWCREVMGQWWFTCIVTWSPALYSYVWIVTPVGVSVRKLFRGNEIVAWRRGCELPSNWIFFKAWRGVIKIQAGENAPTNGWYVRKTNGPRLLFCHGGENSLTYSLFRFCSLWLPELWRTGKW